jgi:hypothetical protein
MTLQVVCQGHGEHRRTRLRQHVDLLLGTHEQQLLLLFRVLPAACHQDGFPLGRCKKGLEGVPTKIDVVDAAGKGQAIRRKNLPEIGMVHQLAREALPCLLAGRNETVRAVAADRQAVFGIVADEPALIGDVEPLLVADQGFVLVLDKNPAGTPVTP